MKFYYLYCGNICKGVFKTQGAAERFGDKFSAYIVKCQGKIVSEKKAKAA